MVVCQYGESVDVADWFSGFCAVYEQPVAAVEEQQPTPKPTIKRRGRPSKKVLQRVNVCAVLCCAVLGPLFTTEKGIAKVVRSQKRTTKSSKGLWYEKAHGRVHIGTHAKFSQLSLCLMFTCRMTQQDEAVLRVPGSGEQVERLRMHPDILEEIVPTCQHDFC